MRCLLNNLRSVSWTALLISVLSSRGAFAQGALIDIDFSAPDVGFYSILGGSPTTVSSYGGMSDALLFHATSPLGEGIIMNLGAQPLAYAIDFDVVTHGLRNSLYAFTVYLATPETRSVSIHGGLNAVTVYQPTPYTDRGVLPFFDNVPQHINVVCDFTQNTWEVSVNGLQVYRNVFNATDVQQIAFALRGWHTSATDNPNVLVALDNIRVQAIPEPSAFLIFACAAALAYVGRGRR